MSEPEPLTEEEVVSFRERLQKRREDLIEEAGRTAHDMGDHEAEGFADPTDRGSLEGERNLELRIRDRERKLLVKIDQALERIQDGTFGFCETCEEPIGSGRLEVRPVTTLCIRCKEEEEEQERGGAR